MKILLAFIGSVVVATFSLILISIAHENDIYRQCVKQGNSGMAGWTIKIKCEPFTK